MVPSGRRDIIAKHVGVCTGDQHWKRQKRALHALIVRLACDRRISGDTPLLIDLGYKTLMLGRVVPGTG